MIIWHYIKNEDIKGDFKGKCDCMSQKQGVQPFVSLVFAFPRHWHIPKEYRMFNLSVYIRKTDAAVHLDTAVHKEPFKLCFSCFMCMYVCTRTWSCMCACVG